MARTRAIYGCAGLSLTEEEKSFFREARPWGFILFGRNVKDVAQVSELVRSLRETVEDDAAPVLIDQEGGRVARLKPPAWAKRPPAVRFADLHNTAPEAAREAVYLHARLIANDLFQLGITVDCFPVLDLPVEGSSDVIGDRALGRDAATIIDLGREAIDGLMEGGVLPVMKHIPGHGRATADSHLAVPRVAVSRAALSATDFVPFRSLAHCPMAMTAHVIYEAIDPVRPATISPRVVKEAIRGEIGFDGLLLSDDLSMNALSGTLGQRTKAALFAGCDIALHCNGNMDEMRAVAHEASSLDGLSLRRAETALSHLTKPEAFDAPAAEAHLAELLGVAA
ncbi:MAG TPA: beta-N-acetylhexosaminidase [Rhizomicrobium sp.]|jgi:beta-N-acetylhexosaminidase